MAKWRETKLAEELEPDDQFYESETFTEVKFKRKAGRPKGSKNKAKSPNYPQQGIKMRATIIIDYLIDKGDYRRVVELEDEMIALLQKYSADNPNVIMMDKVDKSGSTVYDDDGNVIREKAAQVVFNPRRGEKPPNINNMKFRTS